MDMVSSEVYDEATIEIVIGGGSSVAAASTPAEAENAPPVSTAIPHNCSTAAQDVPISGAPGDGCDTYVDSDTGTVTRVAAFSVDWPTSCPAGTSPSPGRSKARSLLC